MQISNDNYTTDDRMDISTSMEITRDCEGQMYFDFLRSTSEKDEQNRKDDSSNE